jgi:zinc protease
MISLLNRLLAWVAICLLGLISQAGASIPEIGRLPEPQVEVLKSGLKIAWFDRADVPLIDFLWVFEGGTQWDPPRGTGVSTLAASLLTRGTARRSEREISDLLDQHAMTLVAGADDDFFSLSGNALTQDSELLLSLSLEVLFDRKIDPSQFSKRKSLIVDQWRQLRESPQSLVSLLMGRALSAGTPYQGKGSLVLRDFGALKISDVEKFLSRQVRPEQATLVIAGRVNREQIKDQIERATSRYLATQSPFEVSKPASFRIRAKDAGWLPGLDRQGRLRIAVVHRADQTQSQIALGWAVPKIQEPGRVELSLANTVIGELFSSRLNLRIRDELGLTYGVSSTLSYRKQAGDWTVSTSTRTDKTGEVLKEILAELKRVRDFGLSQEELDRAKTYVLGSFPLTVAHLPAIASRWLQSNLFSLGQEYFQGSTTQIQKVTLTEVNALLKNHLVPEKAWVVMGGNFGEIKKSLDAHQFKDSERVNPEALIRE